MVSKRAYSGINVFLLESAGYTSNWWGTFKQIQAKGGHVRKGEKSTIIVFWKMLKVSKKGAQPGEVSEDNIPMLRYYRVFNEEQCEGLDLPQPDKPTIGDAEEFDSIQAAEDISIEYLNGQDGLDVKHGGNRAYYSPGLDHIQMPPKKAFKNPGEYYSTLFHEMGHSSGHKSRLNRKEILEPSFFGSHDYSREELVAEMTAAFLCREAGINNTVKNSSAYIQSWLRKFEDDPSRS